MASTKSKGDHAELAIAADLLRRGYKVAFRYGEDWDFDLVLCRNGILERVQTKYAKSDGWVVAVSCRSHSLTNGRVRATKKYTAETIDWLALYDATTRRCFYIPAGLKRAEPRSASAYRQLGTGQRARIWWAHDYHSLDR
jgi:hypothetical protein